MVHTTSVVQKKLELWLALSACHPDDLSPEELKILGHLDADWDVKRYQQRCEEKGKYIPFSEFAEEVGRIKRSYRANGQAASGAYIESSSNWCIMR